MLLKFVVCCAVIVASVQNSLSLNVKCINESDGVCKIGKINHFLPDDQLNLVGLENRHNITTFYLSNLRAMITFPIEIFEQLPSLKTVELRNVSIENLTEESFAKSHQKLLELTITRANLKVIPNNLKIYFPNLSKLDVRKNQISTIEKEVFVSSSLKELDLHGNQFKTIKKAYFYNATQLEEIDLSFNLIEEIEDGAFDLPWLGTLRLDGNRLKTLPTNLFVRAQTLWFLSLGRNQLSEIAALKKAQQLEFMFMEHVPTLKNVDVLSSLIKLPKLKFLDLHNTSFTMDMSAGALKSNTLIELNLSQNNLNDSRLLEHFSGLKKLEYLVLYDNNLRKLDNFDKIGDIFNGLIGIPIEGNPWDCEWIKSASNICDEEHIDCDGILKGCHQSSAAVGQNTSVALLSGLFYFSCCYFKRSSF